MIEKHIDNGNLIEQLRKNGFSAIEQRVPLDVIMQGDELFNVDGPFDPQWRRGDSIWSLVSDDDLNDVLESSEILLNFSALKSLPSSISIIEENKLNCPIIDFSPIKKYSIKIFNQSSLSNKNLAISTLCFEGLWPVDLSFYKISNFFFHTSLPSSDLPASIGTNDTSSYCVSSTSLFFSFVITFNLWSDPPTGITNFASFFKIEIKS